MALKFESRYGADKIAKFDSKKVVFTGGRFHPASGKRAQPGQPGGFILMADPFGRERVIPSGRKKGETTKDSIYSTVANAYYAHMARFATPKDPDETAADWHDEIASARGPQMIRDVVADMRNACIIDREAWDANKDEILAAALTARFVNDQAAAQLLLATEKRQLVYESARDIEFSGDNRLGVALTKVRDELAAKAEERRKARQSA